MEKISIISFTGNGTRLCSTVVSELKTLGYEVNAYAMEAHMKEPGICPSIRPLKGKLQEWTGEQFQDADAIIYIGAVGIAVRAIAPFVKDKTTDPAVIVIDEKARFVIPVLSGHIGGANELAGELSLSLNSMPVITTATDLNQLFAVDVFAVKNNLFISSMDYAKRISAALLRHEKIGLASDFEIKGILPEQITPELQQEYGICISLSEKSQPFAKTLNLIPRVITLGIGCRKGKTLEEIEQAVFEVLERQDISIHAVRNVASIDLKKEERGLVDFCRKYGLEFQTYSSGQLEAVSGSFLESEYVKKVTGTGNVCERAAILGSSYGRMVQEKTARDGVTVSMARRGQVIYIE